MSGLTPTDEQAEAIRLAMTGGHLAVSALAGTGKTSGLVMIADAMHGKRGAYMAFNRVVADDAQGKFPGRVDCRTIHSFANRAIGKNYRHRFDKPRLQSHKVAQLLGVDGMMIRTPTGGRKFLSSGFLAGMAERGVRQFCKSDDPEPRHWHIPTPRTMRDDKDLMAEWKEVRKHLEPSLKKAWADVQNVDGVLRFDHNYYLKMWLLTEPVVPVDYLLVDELQDWNSAMLSLLPAQRKVSQIIGVGDKNQQIMSWNGSIEALSKIEVDHRCTLSHSFRFGPEIAAAANSILDELGAEMRLTGLGPPGRVGEIDYPDLILSRTNAVAVRRGLEEFDKDGTPHIVGGAGDVVSFAKGALSLQAGKSSWHPELACFDSWGDVRAYCHSDELGHDLKLLVELVDDFGAQRIVDSFEKMPPRHTASMVLSTAHKMKGAEAESVQLADDFPDESSGRPVEAEERRLLYVAVTRAKRELDVSAVALLRGIKSSGGPSLPKVPTSGYDGDAF